MVAAVATAITVDTAAATGWPQPTPRCLSRVEVNAFRSLFVNRKHVAANAAAVHRAAPRHERWSRNDLSIGLRSGRAETLTGSIHSISRSKIEIVRRCKRYAPHAARCSAMQVSKASWVKRSAAAARAASATRLLVRRPTYTKVLGITDRSARHAGHAVTCQRLFSWRSCACTCLRR